MSEMQQMVYPCMYVYDHKSSDVSSIIESILSTNGISMYVCL